MQCKICQTTCNFIFNAPILNKYQIPFFKCKNCGFIQCQKAFWLDESYTEAINASDTGILSRNLFLQKTISTLAYFLFGKKAKILDWGGGMVF
ncbi:hypothetical protein LW135_03335 [Helicobacter sp. faydin-H20]|uniref:hypothetical protein n=1 Tax=Helicobacter anatolicus TaxID=2905874 RepID=UPI001E5AA9A1|nr:hypothetical protein [Helicobacter anatolicus]MCE3036863.1 hypothetical protein [Helicobacter anatolicus]